MAIASAPSKRYSIDDLAEFPDDGKRRELVDGRIVEWDVTTLRHGFFITVLARTLSAFALQHRLGLMVSSDAMIRILDSRYDARGPDVALYARGRIPSDLDAAAAASAPDFVIEVLSPSDRASEVQAKVRDWLRTGVRLLWYVDLEAGVTTVYHGDTVVYVDADDVLDGGDVVPGFSLRLREVFDELESLKAEDA